jgi:ribosomal protein S12 methylthiotransferase accessory factor YcaO
MENAKIERLIQKIEKKFGGGSVYRFNDWANTGVHHFVVCSENLEGYGSDFSPLVALKKALSECVEKKILQQYKLPTNLGSACHTNKTEAKKSALNELLEHDGFLCCWLMKQTPAWFSQKQLCQMQLPSFKTFISCLRLEKSSLKVGVVCITKNKYILIGRVKIHKNLNTGFVASTACNTSIHKACLAIYLTLLRSTTILFHKDIFSSQQKEILFNRKFCIAESYKFNYNWFLKKRNSNIMNLPKFKPSIRSFENKLTKYFHLKFFIAKSAQCQKNFSGKTTPENINFKRIQLCKKFTEKLNQKINYLVHPIC